MLTAASEKRVKELRMAFQTSMRRLLAAWHAAGINVQVSHGYRSKAQQEALFSIGRTKPGKVVTNARPGQSPHNYGLAADVVVIEAGKAVWSKAAYIRLWEIAEREGLGSKAGVAWAGNWKKFKEYVHFESANWKKEIL